MSEGRIGVKQSAHGPAIQLKRLRGLHGDRPELPLVRREQPRPANHVTSAEGFDDERAVPGHLQVEGYLAGLDQPQPVGRPAFLEEPVPGWHRYVPRDLARRAMCSSAMPRTNGCTLSGGASSLLIASPLRRCLHIRLASALGGRRPEHDVRERPRPVSACRAVTR